MKAGGKDGANTRTGLICEGKVNLATFIAKQKKYTVKDCGVLNLGECVAHIFKKYAFNTFLVFITIEQPKLIRNIRV